jgi:hypothetical protein
VHIDDSFDNHNQHFRQVHPAVPLVKSSSFITVVVADQKHMERIDGGAVSANLLGECMYHEVSRPGGVVRTSGMLVMALRM